MSATKRVLLIDDDAGRNARWVEDVKSASSGSGVSLEVMAAQTHDVTASLEVLHRRRAGARREDDGAVAESTIFDGADVLLVDYDLFDLDEKTDVTGEMVAYLARCYSTCGLIVGVNQFVPGDRTFDLRLTGHPESFADVHISAQDLRNPGLWVEPWTGFRPWAWPLLPEELGVLEARVSAAREHLDDPVVGYFGFDEATPFPTRALEYLGKGSDPKDVSLRDFVTKSGSALRLKDAPLSDDFIARIAAARLAKWLATEVLAGQYVLVDAPHLVHRFPSLLGGATDMATWNRLTSAHVLELPVFASDQIESFRFEHSYWTSRPVWKWQELRSLEAIVEVRDPWSADPPPFVFCEDTSEFVSREMAREYVAEVDSPFATRYIRQLPDVSYVPAFLLSL